MNGRIYDPLLGRFLSADLMVQFAGDLQSYNRYSYVRNNPLTTIDPSGFEEAEPEPSANFANQAQQGLQANYNSQLSQALKALAEGDRFTYTEIMEREVMPRGRQLGLSYPRDANYNPRSPGYTELRDASKPYTIEEKLAFEARAAEFEAKTQKQPAESELNKGDAKGNSDKGAVESKEVFYELKKDGVTTYPGITNNPERRTGEHADDKDFDEMHVLSDPLPHAQARSLEGRELRDALAKALAAGKITGKEPIAEQLQKAGLDNQNRGRTDARWVPAPEKKTAPVRVIPNPKPKPPKKPNDPPQTGS